MLKSSHALFKLLWALILASLLFSGDEVIAINGHSLHGSAHEEAINLFRGIKNGKVTLHFLRREGRERER